MAEESPQHCTYKTLKALMDERDRRYEERFQAQEKATRVFEENSKVWRENANEWRQAMTDKDRNFVTKSALWGYVLAGIGVAIVVMTFLYTVFGK